MTLYYITCQSKMIYASTDYDQAFEVRARLDAAGFCAEPHPIRSRSITA